MNYKQIADLYRVDDWFRCLGHKIGHVFEVQEEYTYNSELGIVAILPKGLKLVFTGVGINTWFFSPKEPEDLPNFRKIGFGRSRLLKLKLKELQSPLSMETPK